jgi:hypothetical protein
MPSGFTALEVYCDHMADLRLRQNVWAGRPIDFDREPPDGPAPLEPLLPGEGPGQMVAGDEDGSQANDAPASPPAQEARPAEAPEPAGDGPEIVSLRGQTLDAETLSRLAGNRRLRVLNLAGSSIDDAGLARLTDLPNLQALDLRGTRVTDAGLAHVRSLSSLRLLRLPARIDAEAIDSVRSAIPGLLVEQGEVE